jgi:hypothetical protein
VKELTVFTRRAGGSEPAELAGRAVSGALTGIDDEERTVLDLPHPDERARAKFARRGRFPIDALVWGGPVAQMSESFDAGARFVVERHLGWRAPDAAGVDAGDVVKQVSFLWATDGVGLDDFRAHYRAHVDVARRYMHTLWQYVQNDVVLIDDDADGASDGVVAVSELWFRATDDYLHRYFASPDDEAAFRSHEGFLDLAKAFSFICASYAPAGGRA